MHACRLEVAVRCSADKVGLHALDVRMLSMSALWLPQAWVLKRVDS